MVAGLRRVNNFIAVSQKEKEGRMEWRKATLHRNNLNERFMSDFRKDFKTNNKSKGNGSERTFLNSSNISSHYL